MMKAKTCSEIALAAAVDNGADVVLRHSARFKISHVLCCCVNVRCGSGATASTFNLDTQAPKKFAE